LVPWIRASDLLLELELELELEPAAELELELEPQPAIAIAPATATPSVTVGILRCITPPLSVAADGGVFGLIQIISGTSCVA
jgi:hypothetical protein